MLNKIIASYCKSLVAWKLVRQKIRQNLGIIKLYMMFGIHKSLELTVFEIMTRKIFTRISLL